ncbi:MAG: hypothetical protein GXP14_03420 [Gammaproteobacteria bacterium]|nr:hypothetical protein [Gammaproteobacteria bacterium]
MLQTRKTSIAYSTTDEDGNATDGVAYFYSTQYVVSSEDREVTTLRYFINNLGFERSLDKVQFESISEAVHIKLN